MELEFVKLENNNTYCILKTIINDNIKYLYLININDLNDYVIRKEVDGKFIGLDNEEEFNKVIQVFVDVTNIKEAKNE